MNIFRRVACCLSGGVDSSVAAFILKQKGYEVTGVFMRNWDIADETGFCNANKEQEDAEFVCRTLKIPFIQANFVKEYWNDVFCELIQEYENGLLPNPDILCNKRIKFGAFYDYFTTRLKLDAFATGHYANSSFGMYLEHYKPNESVKLLKAKDPDKDQTFFLSQIPQKALQHCMFPLGNLTKASVKKIALEAGLEKIAKKRESTGICFIGQRNFQDFIKEYIHPKVGNFIDIETNQVVGQHNGIHNWTLGQRSRVVYTSGQTQPKPYFVVSKDVTSQNIYVVQGTDHPALFCKSMITEAAQWIDRVPEQLQRNRRMECDFRFQHRKPLVRCCITVQETGLIHIDLEKALRALTCGQYAIFYLGDECLGSARIIELGPSLFEISSKQLTAESESMS